MVRVKSDDGVAYVYGAVADSRSTCDGVAALSADIVAAADLIAEAFASGRQLLLCGNGGSAADAQHLAAEFIGRFMRDREPWPAIALSTNTSTLTAVGNDMGFEQVFARQVRAHGHPGDVLLAISTSGGSANVLRAIDVARAGGMRVICLTGPKGRAMAAGCDVCLAVPGVSTARVQEGHILVGHIICGLVEDALS
jgi:D-sedoheptulose 7-phosphate isomerase